MEHALKLTTDYIRDSYSQQKVIPLGGVYSYTNRTPSFSLKKYDKALGAIKCPSMIQKAIIEKAKEERNLLARGWDNCGRFMDVSPAVSVDMFSALEILGVMTYSKSCTLVYSFWDRLDYILAFLFHEDLGSVRASLAANCEKYGVTYEELSYAFCTNNAKMISGINLEVFVGLAEQLDMIIQQLLYLPAVCIYPIGDELLDLRDTTYSREERITAFLIAKINYCLRFMIGKIVQLFKKDEYPFCCSKHCMPVSLSVASFVVTTHNVELPPITYKLEDMPEFTIKPISIYDRGI